MQVSKYLQSTPAGTRTAVDRVGIRSEQAPYLQVVLHPLLKAGNAGDQDQRQHRMRQLRNAGGREGVGRRAQGGRLVSGGRARRRAA